MLQHHHSTDHALFISVSDEHTKTFFTYIVSKMRYGLLPLYIKMFTTSQKSVKHDNIDNLCLCLKLDGQELLSTFQTYYTQSMATEVKIMSYT